LHDLREWDELDPSEQQAASNLGWNKHSWDSGEWTSTHDVSWSELSKSEQAAASVIGYTAHSWNQDTPAHAEQQHEPKAPYQTKRQVPLRHLLGLVLQELLAIALEIAEGNANGADEVPATNAEQRWWSLLKPVIDRAHQAAARVCGEYSEQAATALALQAQASEAGDDSVAAIQIHQRIAVTNWQHNCGGIQRAARFEVGRLKVTEGDLLGAEVLFSVELDQIENACTLSAGADETEFAQLSEAAHLFGSALQALLEARGDPVAANATAQRIERCDRRIN
jgi:hypothetical protein